MQCFFPGKAVVLPQHYQLLLVNCSIFSQYCYINIFSPTQPQYRGKENHF